MNKHFLYLSILALLFWTSCKTTAIYEPSRINYNLAKKELTTTAPVKPGEEAKSISEPVYYRAGQILVIDISHYNPLREEISTDDSTSTSFLTDTASFSKYIILPNVPNMGGGQAAANAPQAQPQATQTKDGRHPQTRPATPNTAPTSCDKIKQLMKDYDAQKKKIQDAMTIYKSYLSQIENINDCYTILQKVDDLTSEQITSILKSNFIDRMNVFLTANGMAVLPNDPNQITQRDLELDESDLYSKIKSARQDLEKISAAVDTLKGADCVADFPGLLKTFLNTENSLQNQLTQFDSSYSQKTYPGFEKTVGIFTSLKQYIAKIPDFPAKTKPIINDVYVLRIYKKTADQTTKTHFDDITIEPRRGVKVDVAAGFFVSGLADQAFTLRSKDSIFSQKFVNNGVPYDSIIQGKVTSINKQSQSAASYGGMVYLHVYSQNSGYFNYGVSLGFGALFNDQTRWVGSFGPTILLGKNQRFTINPSIMISQVTRLSAPYQTGVWYTETIDNPPTFKATKVSWGLGFSWNFHI